MNKVFSGIRPSGKLHLGNYLGAINNWLTLQETSAQSIFAIVDLHGITTPYNPKEYQQQIMDVALNYLAAGINPDKSMLIRQSKVPQHTELAWILNTITPTSWLDRLPNYREKVDQVDHSDSEKSKSYQNNLSLLAYPVLMAADILLYKSNLVPVGDDQKQHIDLTNEIGARFNHVFSDVFPNVKLHIVQGARIMSLQDPTKKMSKTGDDGVALSDDPETIREKFKKATTDSDREIRFDEINKPGISNLLTVYSLVSQKTVAALEKEYSGKGYVEFKNDVAEATIQFLKPFQEKRREYAKDMGKVEIILKESEEKARTIAETTMEEVREKMGL